MVLFVLLYSTGTVNLSDLIVNSGVILMWVFFDLIHVLHQEVLHVYDYFGQYLNE